MSGEFFGDEFARFQYNGGGLYPDSKNRMSEGGWWQKIDGAAYMDVDKIINEDDLVHRILRLGLFYRPKLQEQVIIRANLIDELSGWNKYGVEAYSFNIEHNGNGRINLVEMIDPTGNDQSLTDVSQMMVVINRPVGMLMSDFRKPIENFISELNRRLNNLKQPKIPLFPGNGF